MATVNDFLKWVEVIGFNSIYHKIHLEEDGQEEDTGARRVRLNLYTHNHRYAISAVQAKGKHPSYLGCISYNRSPHAGEKHIRSADLHDGRLTKETWNYIKDDILSHELVSIGSAQFNPQSV